MLKRIHVNQTKIRSNAKRGLTQPVLTVKAYKKGNKTHSTNSYGHEVIIRDAGGNECARLVYRPNDPLPCGAKVWIESENEVETIITM
tara:strand:- start:224 stop:487 length:264 start_codon:yes stop_codon:yes gene_type:complete